MIRWWLVWFVGYIGGALMKGLPDFTPRWFLICLGSALAVVTIATWGTWRKDVTP